MRQDVKVGDKLYRFYDDTVFEDRPAAICCRTFRAVKVTACTVLLSSGWPFHGDKERRMLLDTRRPFAHLNKREAAEAYANRKFRHIEHLRRQLTMARERFSAIKEQFGIEMDEPPDMWFKRMPSGVFGVDDDDMGY